MVSAVTEKYKPIDGVYPPGWDMADWPDPPDKFFDPFRKKKYIFCGGQIPLSVL